MCFKFLFKDEVQALKRSEKAIEKLAKEEKAHQFGKHGQLIIYGPAKATITYSNTKTVFKTENHIYRFPKEKMSRIIVLDNRAIAYYSLLDDNSPIEEMSLSEFKKLKEEYKLKVALSMNNISVYSYPKEGINIGQFDYDKNGVSATLNNISFRLDTKGKSTILLVDTDQNIIYTIAR